MKCVVCRLYIYTPDTILNDLVLKCIIYTTAALLCFRSAFILSLLDRGLSALKFKCICIEAQLNNNSNHNEMYNSRSNARVRVSTRMVYWWMVKHGLTRGCHGQIRSWPRGIGHTWPYPEGMTVRSGHTWCTSHHRVHWVSQLYFHTIPNHPSLFDMPRNAYYTCYESCLHEQKKSYTYTRGIQRGVFKARPRGCRDRLDVETWFWNRTTEKCNTQNKSYTILGLRWWCLHSYGPGGFPSSYIPVHKTS